MKNSPNTAGEARAAGRHCGVALENLHFLDMPFYETGRVTKKPLSEADITILVDLLDAIRPHQIYAAGDLSDPHGTHRTCLAAVERALAQVETREWYEACEVWLYRGAWHEWAPHDIEMAVPLSPAEVSQFSPAIEPEAERSVPARPSRSPRSERDRLLAVCRGLGYLAPDDPWLTLEMLTEVRDRNFTDRVSSSLARVAGLPSARLFRMRLLEVNAERTATLIVASFEGCSGIAKCACSSDLFKECLQGMIDQLEHLRA